MKIIRVGGHRQDSKYPCIALVDDEDYEQVSKYVWGLNHSGYARTATKPRYIFMHHLIIECPKGLFVDHIDGHPLNNQKSNLRIVSHKQNCRNQHSVGRGSSYFKGVSKADKKWRAYICVDAKQIHLGVFKNEKDAAKAYNEAALSYFGEYCHLNQI